MNVVCIIAGGVGRRFGSSVPKQFVEVLGKPIIAHTMQRLEEIDEVDAYLVVCVAGYEETVRAFEQHYGFRKMLRVVTGGDSFGKSVRNGVFALEEICADDDVFIIHMAIAPLVPDEIMHDVVAVCKKHGNAFSAEPSYMCMCRKDGEGYSDTYLDRETLFGLNTPQAVRYGTILDLYRRAQSQGYDLEARPHMSTLLFDMGERVHFSKSSPVNIKITTPDDLALFEAFLLMKQQEPAMESRGTEGTPC